MAPELGGPAGRGSPCSLPGDAPQACSHWALRLSGPGCGAAQQQGHRALLSAARQAGLRPGCRREPHATAARAPGPRSARAGPPGLAAGLHRACLSPAADWREPGCTSRGSRRLADRLSRCCCRAWLVLAVVSAAQPSRASWVACSWLVSSPRASLGAMTLAGPDQAPLRALLGLEPLRDAPSCRQPGRVQPLPP